MNRILALSSLILVAACNSPDPHLPLSQDFGNAVNYNMSVQIVNPNGSPATDWATDGKKSGDAVDRYRRDRVKPPQPPIESAVKQGGPSLPPILPADTSMQN